MTTPLPPDKAATTPPMITSLAGDITDAVTTALRRLPAASDLPPSLRQVTAKAAAEAIAAWWMTPGNSQALTRAYLNRFDSPSEALLHLAAQAQLAVAWLNRQFIEDTYGGALTDQQWNWLLDSLPDYDIYADAEGTSSRFVAQLLADAGITGSGRSHVREQLLALSGDLYLTFDLAEAFDLAELAAGRGEQHLLLVLDRGIQLCARKGQPVWAHGWQPAGSVVGHAEQLQRRRVSHFGGDSQQHELHLADGLHNVLTAGAICGNTTLVIKRSADAFTMSSSSRGLDTIPTEPATAPELRRHRVLRQLGHTAAATSGPLAKRAELARLALDVLASAAPTQRPHLLSLPISTLFDIAVDITGSDDTYQSVTR